MPLGSRSIEHLSTCHPELRRLIECVAAGIDEGDLAYAGVRDITVLCGYRAQVDQDKAVADGASKTPWPRSKHNRWPSDAVDVVPFPIDWANTKALDALHAYIAGVAHARGIDLADINWDRPHIQRNVP